MANINYRSTLGRPLTSAEVDSNFSQLNVTEHNLIFNGSGELGLVGWSFPGDVTLNAGPSTTGPMFDAGKTTTKTTRTFVTDFFNIQGNIANSFSISYLCLGMSADDLYCDILYYDAGGNIVKDGDNYGMSQADSYLFHTFSFSDSAPSNAVQARFRIVITNGKWDTLRWTKAMATPMQPFPTAYNSDSNWYRVFLSNYDWSGGVRFKGSLRTADVTISGVSLGLDGANPTTSFKKADAPVDQKTWDIQVGNNSINFRAPNDAWSTWPIWLSATRSGASVTGIAFSLRPTFAGNMAWDAGNFNPANYLPLTGGTLTGWLTMALTTNDAVGFISSNAGYNKYLNFQSAGRNRWQQGSNGTAESGSNVGSDWFLNRCDDNGNTIDTVMLISRSTGLTQFNRGLTVNQADLTVNASGASDRYVIINRPSGQNGVFRITTSGVPRWDWGGNNGTESGNNAGSDWILNRFADNGAFIDTAITVRRANGVATFWRPPVIDGNANSIDANLTLSSGAGKYRYVSYSTGANVRWLQGVNGDAESGGNTGSNWLLSRYADNGAYIDSPIAINRGTGAISMKGRTDGGAVPTGMIGEILTFNSLPNGVIIGPGNTAVCGVNLPAGIWLCTVTSILKNGTPANVFIHTWSPTGTVGPFAYAATERPMDGNWQTLISTIYVRNTAPSTESVYWSVFGTNGQTVSGNVDVIAVRIA